MSLSSFQLVLGRLSARPFTFAILSMRFWAVWILLTFATTLVEILQAPSLTPRKFYALYLIKGFSFVVLGFVTPLTFRGFDQLVKAVTLLAAMASSVEILQAFVHHGHSFTWYELALKPMLILWGFSVALIARYEKKISLGPVQLTLVDRRAD